jgi:hypothetical protein
MSITVDISLDVCSILESVLMLCYTYFMSRVSFESSDRHGTRILSPSFRSLMKTLDIFTSLSQHVREIGVPVRRQNMIIAGICLLYWK